MKATLALLLAGSAGAFVFPKRSACHALRLWAEGDASEEAVAVEAEAPEAEAPAVEAVVAEAPAAEEPAAEAPAAEDKPKRKSKKDATPLAALEVGKEYEGTVTGVAAYGCFVDIGAAADGLVHISELSASFVDDVASVVKEGDAVTVRVLKIDEQKKQLGLSMKPEGSAAPPKRGGGGKRTKKAGAEELRKYLDADPQEFVAGTVRTVLSWGAFVNIADGVDGLVHISRVSDERVEDLEAVLKPGDEVQVRVVEVDLDKATLALAMNTYRDPASAPPRRSRDDDAGGESAAARRARDPDAKFGGQAKPRRRDPGDDIWDNTDAFDWKDVIEVAENEDDLASGIQIDVETGQLTLQ